VSIAGHVAARSGSRVPSSCHSDLFSAMLVHYRGGVRDAYLPVSENRRRPGRRPTGV